MGGSYETRKPTPSNGQRLFGGKQPKRICQALPPVWEGSPSPPPPPGVSVVHAQCVAEVFSGRAKGSARIGASFPNYPKHLPDFRQATAAPPQEAGASAVRGHGTAAEEGECEFGEWGRNRAVGALEVCPRCDTLGNPLSLKGGLVFRPFLLYHRSGFHFPRPWKEPLGGFRHKDKH